MIIFLDIDGVMVPAKGWNTPELLKDGFPVFNDKAVAALNALLVEGASIMLTTSHKSNFSIDEWEVLFLSIILDDDKCLNDLPLFLKERLIQPSPCIGLTLDHLEEARCILGVGHSVA